ncbi:hypothetical protein D3C81_304940 [compost metagenome]
MKRFIFVVLLSLFSLSALADCTITASSLTDVTRKQLELDCLKAQAVELAPPQVDAKKVSEYAGVAKEVAEAIGIAAKNLGVEVNNFITTPAGLLTVAIILIKIFGKLIGAILASILICTVLIKILKYMWTEPLSSEEAQPIITGGWFFGYGSRAVQPRRFVSYKKAEDTLVGWTVIAVIVMLVSIILIPVIGF